MAATFDNFDTDFRSNHPSKIGCFGRRKVVRGNTARPLFRSTHLGRIKSPFEESRGVFDATARVSDLENNKNRSFPSKTIRKDQPSVPLGKVSCQQKPASCLTRTCKEGSIEFAPKASISVEWLTCFNKCGLRRTARRPGPFGTHQFILIMTIKVVSWLPVVIKTNLQALFLPAETGSGGLCRSDYRSHRNSNSVSDGRT
jgi:hypothetical protein